MTHFLPVNNNIKRFLLENENNLRYEFFENIFPTILGDKPLYVRTNGEQLYNMVIRSKGLKVCSLLLDGFEKKIEAWGNEKYRYHTHNNTPTWNLLLETFQDELEQVLFNVAYPGANISFHYGVSSHCYRAHWCLQNNDGFTFIIEGESKPWLTGVKEMFMFDDGPLLHGVKYQEKYNSQPRIICILDIKKEYCYEQ